VDVDGRRIFLAALALGVGAAVVWVRLNRPEVRTPAAEERAAGAAPAPGPATPELDASDPAIRRVIARVSNGEAASALFRSCDEDQADRIRIATVPGYRPDARQRELVVTNRGNGALLEYFDRRFPDIYAASDMAHRRVLLDATEWQAFRKLLADGGYPHAIAPAHGDVCSDGAWRRIESCLEGRYYAAFRGCGVDALDTLSEAAYAFARDRTATEYAQDVSPRPITVVGEIVVTHHGSYLEGYDDGEDFGLSVADDPAARAAMSRVIELGSEFRGGSGAVRGRFSGVLRGPAGIEWFELHDAEDLQRVERGNP
jgi:hypothetical protein